MKIAFSGVGNTGKSSIINGVYKDGKLIEKGLVHMGLSDVLFLGETARNHMDKLPNITDFQRSINSHEIARLQFLKEGDQEKVVTDRTFYDNVLYAKRNGVEVIDPMDDKTAYDLVVLLTKPIKDSYTEEFTHYNDPDFVAEFNKEIFLRYSPNVSVYTNGVEYRQEIIDEVYNLLK